MCDENRLLSVVEQPILNFSSDLAVGTSNPKAAPGDLQLVQLYDAITSSSMSTAGPVVASTGEFILL
jgi:hypothetical protein